MRKGIFSILFICALDGVASAQTFPNDSASSGWTYFNKPGATLAQHHAAIDECFTPVAAVAPIPNQQFYDPVAANPGYYVDTYGAGGAAVGSLVVVSIQLQQIRDAQNRSMVTNYENCMVARGWRVVRLDTEAGRRMNRLTRSSLELRLEPMISAAQPEGQIVRAFSGELPPVSPEQDEVNRSTSLSLLAMASDRLATEGLRPPSPRAVLTVSSREERLSAQARASERRQRLEQAQALGASISSSGSLAPVADVSTVPGDASLIVVGSGGLNLTFTRDMTDDADGPVSFSLSASKDAVDSSSQGTFVFAVPPGRWRISHITGPSGTVALCLGAPAFEVRAGDVVFAGAFGEPGSAPDMTLQLADAALAPAPELAARLRPAAYVNGSVADCGGASLLYAYEIPGASFAEGYQWGSRASQ